MDPQELSMVLPLPPTPNSILLMGFVFHNNDFALVADTNTRVIRRIALSNQLVTIFAEIAGSFGTRC